MNFPHLSLGYLGKKSKTQTLNSKFYSQIFDDNVDLSKFIIFPQRIPRKDFFKELIKLECQSFYNEYLKLKCRITNAHYSFVNCNNTPDSRIFFNYSNLLLRYGLCDEVYKLNYLKFNDLNHAIEYKYLIQNAAIEKSLNKHNFLKINGTFLKLCETANITVNGIMLEGHQNRKQKNSCIFN